MKPMEIAQVERVPVLPSSDEREVEPKYPRSQVPYYSSRTQGVKGLYKCGLWNKRKKVTEKERNLRKAKYSCSNRITRMNISTFGKGDRARS